MIFFCYLILNFVADYMMGKHGVNCSLRRRLFRMSGRFTAALAEQISVLNRGVVDLRRDLAGVDERLGIALEPLAGTISEGKMRIRCDPLRSHQRQSLDPDAWTGSNAQRDAQTAAGIRLCREVALP
jgi:hypothetical protein